MTKRLSILALATLFAAPVMAGPSVPDLSINALVPGSPGVAGPRGAGTYSTGFESPDFAPGYIGGQSGWTAFAASTVEGHVDTVNPFAGDQHLRISLDSALQPGDLTGAFSPDLGTQPAGAYGVSVEVSIDATGGADYDVVPQAPSQALLSARVKFQWEGNIQVLDDLGPGLAFVDTGTDWIPGGYRNLTIDFDGLGNTIDYYYDGGLIYSSAAGVFGGTAIEQVVILSDNFHLSENGDFDDLNVTPEPATLALMFIGGVALMRRRR